MSLRNVVVRHPEHTWRDGLDVDWRMSWLVSLIAPVVGGARSQFPRASTEFVCKCSIYSNLSVGQQTQEPNSEQLYAGNDWSLAGTSDGPTSTLSCFPVLLESPTMSRLYASYQASYP